MNNALGAKFSSTTWTHYTATYLLDIVHDTIGSEFTDLASDNVANLLINASDYFSMGFPGREPDTDCVFLNPYGGKTDNKSNAMIQWEELFNLYLKNKIRSGMYLAFQLNQLGMGSDYGMGYFPRVVLPKRVRFLRCEYDMENWRTFYKPKWLKAVGTDDGCTLDEYIKAKHQSIKEKALRGEKISSWTYRWNPELIVYGTESVLHSEIAVYHKASDAWFFPQTSPPHHSALIFLPDKQYWMRDTTRFLDVLNSSGLADAAMVNFFETPDFNKSIVDNFLGV